jgi:hypothetical protein
MHGLLSPLGATFVTPQSDGAVRDYYGTLYSEAEAAVAVETTRGSYGSEYISQPRKKRREEHEERADVRALLRKALSDDAPEAVELLQTAQPIIKGSSDGGLKIDWSGFAKRSASLQAALDAYEAHLADVQRREDEEDDELLFLMMVI